MRVTLLKGDLWRPCINQIVITDKLIIQQGCVYSRYRVNMYGVPGWGGVELEEYDEPLNDT